MVEGWVVVGIVDGPIDKIIKHVIWELLQQQAEFASNSRRKEKPNIFFTPNGPIDKSIKHLVKVIK